MGSKIANKYLLLLMAASPAFGTTISINFTNGSTPDSTMSPTEVAGVAGATTEVSNWNNAVVSGSTGALSTVVDNLGASTGASVTWTTDLSGGWTIGNTVSNGHDRMWNGYLDVGAVGAIVNVTGLTFVGAYDVYVYFDGDNQGFWRVGNYAIGGISDAGEDSENTNWGTGQNTGKFYQLPILGPSGNVAFPNAENDEGNYVKLSGITGSSFTLTATGGGQAVNDLVRAPINGFQIVGTIPEPSGSLLAGFTGMLLMLRRRR